MKVFIKSYLAEDEKSYKIVAICEDGQVETVEVKNNWEVIHVLNPARLIAVNRGIQPVEVSLLKSAKDYAVIVTIGDSKWIGRFEEVDTARAVRLFFLQVVKMCMEDVRE